MHGRERRAAPSEPAADGKPYSKKKLKPKKVRAADVLGPAQPSRRQDKVEAAEPAVVAAPAPVDNDWDTNGSAERKKTDNQNEG